MNNTKQNNETSCACITHKRALVDKTNSCIAKIGAFTKLLWE